jgi:hypothetical protein
MHSNNHNDPHIVDDNLDISDIQVSNLQNPSKKSKKRSSRNDRKSRSSRDSNVRRSKERKLEERKLEGQKRTRTKERHKTRRSHKKIASDDSKQRVSSSKKTSNRSDDDNRRRKKTSTKAEKTRRKRKRRVEEVRNNESNEHESRKRSSSKRRSQTSSKHPTKRKRRSSKSKPSLLINLKEEREGLHLSREQLSQQARIPLDYVQALETGVYKNLQRGQNSEKYKKRYLHFLDLPSTTEIVTPVPSVSPRKMGFIHTITTNSFDMSHRMTLTKVVMAAMIVVVFIVSVLKFVSVISEQSDKQSAIVQVPSSIAAAPKSFFDGVRLRAIGHSRATIYADGELIHQGKLEPMKYMNFPYRKKLIVEIEKIGMVDVYSNGRRVRAQGNLQGNRRLTFVRSENDL